MGLLRIKDVAEMLSVSPSTVYQWAEFGIIPSIKLHGCLRFEHEAILEWVNRNKREPISGYNLITQARGPKKGRCS